MALAKKPTSAPNTTRTTYKRGDIINGKYRLIRLLGEGGTSWVWVAENQDLAAEVAIKLIRSDLEDPTIGERLLGEARSIARLAHPAIVRVFDFGSTDATEERVGDRFIVMELLKGRSLSQRLHQDGPIPPIELVRLMLPIIEALHVAHTEGIVHRDLKPDNIMLATEGGVSQPKLLDFGIAKFGAAHGVKEHKLTQVGVVVGTPSYMSPEQARGDAALDHRSDVFSLMTVMYECLTGLLPFRGDVYNAVMWSIIQDEPPSLLEQGIDVPELWEILRRGLAKDPAQRWQTVRELGEELAGWLELHGISEDLSGRSLRTSWNPARSSMLPPIAPIHSFGDGRTGERPSGVLSLDPSPEISHPSLVPWNSEHPWRTPVSNRKRWLIGLGITAALGLVAYLSLSSDRGDPEALAPAKRPQPAEVSGKVPNPGSLAPEQTATGSTPTGTEIVELSDLETLPDQSETVERHSEQRRTPRRRQTTHPDLETQPTTANTGSARKEKPDPYDFGF